MPPIMLTFVFLGSGFQAAVAAQAGCYQRNLETAKSYNWPASSRFCAVPASLCLETLEFSFKARLTAIVCDDGLVLGC